MIRLHAIVLCLGDEEFLPAAVASVYDHVEGITIGTTYDRDWMGRTVSPSQAVEWVLSRQGDPERKIDLVVLHETNEARARNRLMDLASPKGESASVKQQHAADRARREVDYFLIVDPDEAWKDDELEAARAYLGRRRLPCYRIAGRPYFKSWRWTVDELEWAMCFIRADQRTSDLRRPPRSILRRMLGRVTRGWARRLNERIVGCEDIPSEIAVFHHGSYVGPRRRIEQKLASFGHSAEVVPGWLEEVYDRWEPSTSTDFHPVHPTAYPSARRADDSELPLAVLRHAWPAGYLSDEVGPGN